MTPLYFLRFFPSPANIFSFVLPFCDILNIVSPHIEVDCFDRFSLKKRKKEREKKREREREREIERERRLL